MDNVPSFMTKMREVFGHGMSLAAFSADIRTLTPDDRRYYSDILLKEGHEHLPYQNPAPSEKVANS